ncbi:MAG: hypothetical protein B7X11_00700 [Acidobacteria bacterium 37-65-4]|nr:MAG: hypothetical protein B7X11_00700 [Acidobacteria bacterium 37-65-4]
MKAANPGVLFLPNYYNEVPLQVQQARRLGIATVLLHLPGSLLPLLSALRLCPSFLQVREAPAPPVRGKLASEGIGLVESRPAQYFSAPALSWGQALLLDASLPGIPGGTGTVFDWTLAAMAPRPFVLAGGLGPDNVAAAIAACRPAGVDAASRLESRPGRKDPARIRDFCAAARDAFRATFQETPHAL